MTRLPVSDYVPRRTNLSTASDRPIGVDMDELADRVAWIIRLRWIAAAGVGATVWLVPRAFGVGLAERPLYLVTLGLAVYNAALWSVNHWLSKVGRGFGVSVFAHAQISVDLIFLTALLHFSGGVENPFVCYYVFHVVIASILLSRRATYVQVGLALLFFAAMGLAEFTGLLPHHHLHGYLNTELHRTPTYLVAVGVVTATTLSFTALMATSIVARLRQREMEIVTLSASLTGRARELQQAYDALQRLEREKSEYMRRAAHDLRSPMATVERLLAVVAEGRVGELSDEGRDMLQRARKRIGQILDLAGDLLALSRARDADFSADAKRLDLVAVLQKLEHDFRQRADAVSVDLEFSVCQGPVAVLGDPRALSEMLDNLVSNALKYTPAGGKVRVCLTQSKEGAVIAVADSGIGIGADDIERVFDEFYRGENARESNRDGTGLGLSIAKAIVEAHGGIISVESEPGEGAVFRVVLPGARSTSNPGVRA